MYCRGSRAIAVLASREQLEINMRTSIFTTWQGILTHLCTSGTSSDAFESMNCREMGSHTFLDKDANPEMLTILIARTRYLLVINRNVAPLDPRLQKSSTSSVNVMIYS